MANSFGRALGTAQDALDNAPGTTPQQMDGMPVVNPGMKPANPTGAKFFKNPHTPHGTSGLEKVAGALADKLHKTRKY